MPRMIQIRHVPDELHLALKVRAAQAGMTLSDYLLQEVSRIVARPTSQELMERIRARRRPRLRTSTAEVVRAERDARR